MDKKNEARAAEGMQGEQAQKRQLNEQELNGVNGGFGVDPFQSLGDIINNPSFHPQAGTNNAYCRTCGFMTPHKSTSDGRYACAYCGTIRDNL